MQLISHPNYTSFDFTPLCDTAGKKSSLVAWGRERGGGRQIGSNFHLVYRPLSVEIHRKQALRIDSFFFEEEEQETPSLTFIASCVLCLSTFGSFQTPLKVGGGKLYFHKVIIANGITTLPSSPLLFLQPPPKPKKPNPILCPCENWS